MKKELHESYVELFIHEFWAPEWQLIKIKNYIYNIEHIDSFCATVGFGQISDSDKDGMKEFLIIEIIASTMLLIESLAILMESIINKPKNLQNGFKGSKSTKFYNSISSLKQNDYLKILSLPQKDANSDIKGYELDKGIDNPIMILDSFKKYYFAELELYNSYNLYSALLVQPVIIFAFSTQQLKNHDLSAVQVHADFDNITT